MTNFFCLYYNVICDVINKINKEYLPWAKDLVYNYNIPSDTCLTKSHPLQLSAFIPVYIIS